MPQDLIYTTTGDYPNSYCGYDETIHDFNLDEDAQTIGDLLEQIQSDEDEDDTPGQYGTPRTMPEQHRPASTMQETLPYALHQTPARAKHWPHTVPQLPTIIINENVQSRAAAPARPMAPMHVPAYSHQVYGQQSGTESMYPHQTYRVPHRQPSSHANLKNYNGHVRSGGRPVSYDRFPVWTTDGTRAHHSAAPRNYVPEYEYNCTPVGAGDRESARAFEALSEAFALTRKIDTKMVALKAVLTEVLFSEFPNTY